jgi:hypothetical protein
MRLGLAPSLLVLEARCCLSRITEAELLLHIPEAALLLMSEAALLVVSRAEAVLLHCCCSSGISEAAPAFIAAHLGSRNAVSLGSRFTAHLGSRIAAHLGSHGQCSSR